MLETCRWASLYLVGVLVTSLGIASTASSIEAQERAIMVLDASGSMWGQVDGTPKIAIARDVIRGLLGEWDPNVELGVIAYGHRQKGDCTDIETLVPVGPVGDGDVLAAIETLNPRGKTPLADTVRQAAEALQYTEERATVLLISDGEETCDADPCAAAAELAAKGVDFKVHVVGFDVNNDQKAQLQCIAETTGGQFLGADNASELHEAMTATVDLVSEPVPTTTITAEAPDFGKIKLTNWAGAAGVYDQATGDHLGSADAKRFQEFPVGTYRIRFSEFDIDNVEVIAGEEVIVDPKDRYGWLRLTNWAGAAGVYDQATGDHLGSVDAKRFKEFPVGTYRIRFSEFDIDNVEVIAGEEVIVDPKDRYGWLRLTNWAGAAGVYDQATGDHLGSADAKRFKEFPVGTYRIRFSEFDIDNVEVIAGEEVIVDPKDRYGWLRLTNWAGAAGVYDQATGDHLGSVDAKRFKEFPVGTYRIRFSEFDIDNVEVIAGEEVIINVDR